MQESSNEGDKVQKWKPNSPRGEGVFRLENTPYMSNPLYSGKIRNEKCYCGSGKKVKKCCGKDPIVEDPRLKYVSEDAKNSGSKSLSEMVREIKLAPKDAPKL